MHPQGMDHSIEQPLAPTLGALAVAGVLFDVGDHPRIKNALAIRSGVKAAVEIDIRASQRLFEKSLWLHEKVSM